MEQSNNIKRSELWKQIYNIVETLPKKDCGKMDAPDVPSITTELEEFFYKSFIDNNKELLFNAYKDGFDSATEALIAANNAVQERKI